VVWGLSALDVGALVFFLVAWLGYAPFIRWKTRDLKVASAMMEHRRAWMQAMLGRGAREVDTMVVANIMSSAAFFASTAVVVVGAILGVLIETESKNASPSFGMAAHQPLEIKLVLMLGIALYAFMTYTWSIRQANYLNVTIGAAPPAPVDPELRDAIASSMATIIANVAASYDAGMRSYYFGLGAVAWIVSPVLLLIVTLGIAALLLYRQTRSGTALALEHIAAARSRS
jgi:uncharacterized membrane protein